MASLAASTSAFYDELSKILSAQKQAKEEDMDLRWDRPYSSLLTQDEEPTQEYNPQQLEEAQPEVVTRGG